MGHPVVLVVLFLWTILLEQTSFGRHVYAVGGNPEAARRAGVNVSGVRIWAFVLCSMTAGLGGIIYASLGRHVDQHRRRPERPLRRRRRGHRRHQPVRWPWACSLHGLLGGLVIGAIYNGMFLLGLQLQYQLVAAPASSFSRP